MYIKDSNDFVGHNINITGCKAAQSGGAIYIEYMEKI